MTEREQRLALNLERFGFRVGQVGIERDLNAGKEIAWAQVSGRDQSIRVAAAYSIERDTEDVMALALAQQAANNGVSPGPAQGQ
jgi:hypothetical protein